MKAKVHREVIFFHVLEYLYPSRPSCVFNVFIIAVAHEFMREIMQQILKRPVTGCLHIYDAGSGNNLC